ncbi:RNA polymerase II transcription factor SIII subunit A-domain-containing protein [Phyllosticta citribraziliensis]|uniref:RNA polymerase II transcription factor SIII subunit A-domain-containing protein n=1 Tax=Phyllosticta citribraziliensis TaxID=989973 RepID=A0ABR1LE07_9PEZI
MPAPSLYDIVKRRLQRSVQLVVDVGDIPFHVVEPVLKKIENPRQLKEIEENSPHIAEDTAAMWEIFIRRDIQGWQSKVNEFKNTKASAKLYFKLEKEQTRQIEKEKAELRAKLAQGEKERQKNTSTLINRTFDPTRSRRLPSYSHSYAVSRDPRNFTFAPGETKKRLTGRGIIAKAQQQSQSMVAARRSTNEHLIRSRQISQMTAPKSMLGGSRAPLPIDRGKQAPAKAPAGSATARTQATGSTIRREGESLQDREARLKALTSGHKPQSSMANQKSTDTKAGAAGSSVREAKGNTVPSSPPAIKRKQPSNCLVPPRKRR